MNANESTPPPGEQRPSNPPRPDGTTDRDTPTPSPFSPPPPATPAKSAVPASDVARRMHDELLSSLGKRFRGPAVQLEFHLRTAITRQVFLRDFVHVSQQLHALEASRRVQGIDRRCLNLAIAAIERRAEAVHLHLLQRVAQTRASIAQQDSGETGVTFAPSTRFEATLVSPRARTFVDILCLADEALVELERAWLLGLVDAPTKSARIGECRKSLQSFKETVRQQRNAVGEHVRAVNATRRTARDAPAATPPTRDDDPAADDGRATDAP